MSNTSLQKERIKSMEAEFSTESKKTTEEKITPPFKKEPIFLYQSIGVWSSHLDIKTPTKEVELKLLDKGLKGSFLLGSPEDIRPYLCGRGYYNPRVFVQVILDNTIIEKLRLKNIFPNDDKIISYTQRGNKLTTNEEFLEESGIKEEELNRKDPEYERFRLLNQIIVMNQCMKVLKEPDKGKQKELISQLNQNRKGWYTYEWGIKPYSVDAETKEVKITDIPPEYITALIYEIGPFAEKLYEEDKKLHEEKYNNDEWKLRDDYDRYEKPLFKFLPDALENIKKRIQIVVDSISNIRKKGKPIFFGVRIPFLINRKEETIKLLKQIVSKDDKLKIYQETEILPVTQWP